MSHYPDGEPPAAPSWLDHFIPVTRAEARNLVRDEVQRGLKDIWGYVLEQTNHITVLGERMSAVDDIVTALNAATDEIASDLAALRDEVAGSDAAVAAKFQPLLDRLTDLGKDPENPVPDPEPTPEPEPSDDGGDTPAE